MKENPSNLDARGVVLYGASIATSGRFGIGKEEIIATTFMRMVELFAGFGIDMYFNGNLDKELIGSISVESVLKPEEIVYILEASMR